MLGDGVGSLRSQLSLWIPKLSEYIKYKHPTQSKWRPCYSEE